MVLETEKIYQGNCVEVLKDMPNESIDCVVTSPPYWGLRNYQNDEQLGLEETPEEFVANLVKVFSEVKRVLKSSGTCWLNLGDTYYNKSLAGIPFRVAFALQADGWYLRQDIIWAKNNCMPESVKDRCTKSHEYIFLLTKSPKYFYDADAIREPVKESSIQRAKYGWSGTDVEKRNQPDKCEKLGKRYVNEKGRNKRSVWRMNTSSVKDAHFATFPIELPTYCIKAGCPEGGIVLDPFFGSGTTGLAAQEQSKHWVGIELNEEYIEIAHRRLSQKTLFV